MSVSGVAAAQSSPPTEAPVAIEQQELDAAARRPHPWRAHPFAVDGMVGVATPTGNLGVWADFAPIEYLSLSAGLGFNTEGPQVAGMLRTRLIPARRNTPFFGIGYSQGAHLQAHAAQDGILSAVLAPLRSIGEDRDRDQPRHWQTARWLNVEAGWEHRSDSGLDLRVFLGLAHLLNPAENVLDPPRNEDDRPIEIRTTMAYLGAALGFGL